jgi:hypothetical protein
MRFVLTASWQRYMLVMIIVLIVGACNTPKKVDGWIAARYGEPMAVRKPRADYFAVTSSMITADTKASQTLNDNRKGLFLLFYWKKNYSMRTELNPKIAINQFTNSFTVYGNSKHLKEKLNGRTIELVVEKMPRSFSFRDDFRMVFFIVGEVHWDKIYMLPENSEMVLRYTVSGPEKKSGTITLADNNKIQKTRLFQKLSTAYTEYLNEYDENIKTMAKSAVDQLMLDL